MVRAGGVVAVKDVDMQLMKVFPGNPFLLSHLAEASVRGHAVTVQSRGSLRGRELRRWLEEAGLHDVRQRTFLIERWAPLSVQDRRFFGDWLAFLADAALHRGIPVDDRPEWESLVDPEAENNPVNQPDFYLCEGQVLATGTV